MNKIPLFDHKDLFEKGYFKSETYGPFNKQGFKLMSLEKSQKILNEIWNETSEEDYNLMRFGMIWHMNFGCRRLEESIENSMHLFRYILTRGAFLKIQGDEDDNFNIEFSGESLVFPVKNQTLKRKIILGPKLPEIENFKLYKGEEKQIIIRDLIETKNLDKKIFENYLKETKSYSKRS